MNAPTHELRGILSTFRRTSPTSFVLLGREYGTGEESSSEQDRDSDTELHNILQSALYDVLHCRRAVRGFSAPPRLADPHGSAKFVASLSAANAGRGRDSRWSVVQHHDAGVVAEYWGILFHVELPTNTGERAEASEVAVHMPKEHYNVAPGFYVALSDTDDEFDERPRVRVYWHVDASGAAPLVASLTSSLNDAGIGFRLKILSDPGAFSRADAATLYLASEDLTAALPALRATHAAVSDFLYPPVSLLALRLADGVSLAEDPGTNLSFGEDRCDRWARALGSIAGETDVASDSGFAFVLRHVAQSGIDIERMYANQGSTRIYGWAAPAT